MKISAAILAKNEELNLPETLASLSWVDEVVVGVDRTTTDKTSSVAEKSGAQVLLVSLDNGFAAAKNEVIAATKFDWVLVIDADERPEEGLAKEIDQLPTMPGINGYKIRRQNYAFGYPLRHGGWQNDAPIRLINKNHASFDASQKVHETLQVKGEIGQLNGILRHNTHASMSELITKIDLYTTLEAPEISHIMPASPKMRKFIIPMIRQFHWRYWQERGYRDGIPGLAEAVGSAFYAFASHIKAWEIKNKDKNN